MRECSEYEVTVAKLLKIVHRYTEQIKIYVVSDIAAWEDKVREFYITRNFSESQEEIDRVLKYYGDVPVWNIHVEVDSVYSNGNKGKYTVSSIVANCHYADAREGFLREKEDRRKAKRRRKKEDWRNKNEQEKN